MNRSAVAFIGLAFISTATHSLSGDERSDACRELIAHGIHSVTCYGARGDGVADDTHAIRRALAAAGPHELVYLPPPDKRKRGYRVTDTIDVTGKWLTGLPTARGYSSIRLDRDLPRVLPAVLESRGTAAIENVSVDANFHAERAIFVHDAREPSTIIRRVNGAEARSDGIVLQNVAFALMEAVTTARAARSGIVLKNTGAIRGRVLVTVRTGDGPALLVEGGSEAPVGALSLPTIDLRAILLERNDGDNVVLRGLRRPSNFEYIWIEGGVSGVRLEDTANARVAHVRIVGGPVPAARNRAIALAKGTTSCVIEAGSVAAATKTKGGAFPDWGREYASVFADESTTRNYVAAMTRASRKTFQMMPFFSGGRNSSIQGISGYRSRGFTRGLFTYRRSVPRSDPTWQAGDIVVNTGPDRHAVPGWYCRESPGRLRCRWTELPE